jgi:hypothetical protein
VFHLRSKGEIVILSAHHCYGKLRNNDLVDREEDPNQQEKLRAATRPAPPNRSSTGCVRTQTTQQPAESVAPSSVRTGDSPGRIGLGERAGRQRTLPRRASRRTTARHCSLARRCIYRCCTGCGFVLYCPYVLAELRCGGRASNSDPRGHRASECA